MTLRNSFWASMKENNKRRIWVWIVAVLTQLVAYVGVLTVYLSRIRQFNADGAYETRETFQDALYLATRDALGFQNNLIIVLIGLALIIGVQGFSYLYDRRKVDLYHSVPVNKGRRFAVVYVNGLIMYLTTTLISLLIGVITAAAQGALNGEVMAVIGLGFVWNLLFFLVMYHTVILAVMLTGNLFITGCVAAGIAGYEFYWYVLGDGMQYAFFDTVSSFYVTSEAKLSVLYDYYAKIWELKRTLEVDKLAQAVLPYYGKWFILSIIVLAAAWLCYRKRPSEAAGRVLAFPKMGSVLKVLAVIPAALGIGMWVYSATYQNVMLTAVSIAASGLVLCAVVEIVYDFDIKGLFRHPVSSGVAVVGIMVIFLIFQQDLFGYDKYLPAEDKLDSVALCIDYYGQFWDEEFNYVGSGDFVAEHMYLKDVEPVLALAEKYQHVKAKDMTDPRAVNVLYRLKSGRKVDRCFHVDYADPANEELLDQIMGSQEFKEGTFQIMTDQESFEQAESALYRNGAASVALPAEDMPKLRELYVRDMEGFDFTLARGNRPCGRITVRFPNWFTETLDVYDSYENTIAYLQDVGAYYPIQLNPEDIADITVTNYHNELNQEMGADTRINASHSFISKYSHVESSDTAYSVDNEVTAVFTDEEEFARIVPAIYPAYLSTAWNDGNELDYNYDIYITFRKDTSYPYDRGEYGVYYKFYTGQVPEFVVEATALDAEQE